MIIQRALLFIIDAIRRGKRLKRLCFVSSRGWLVSYPANNLSLSLTPLALLDCYSLLVLVDIEIVSGMIYCEEGNDLIAIFSYIDVFKRL